MSNVIPRVLAYAGEQIACKKEVCLQCSWLSMKIFLLLSSAKYIIGMQICASACRAYVKSMPAAEISNAEAAYSIES